MADLTYEVTFRGVASPSLQAAFGDHELCPGDGVTSMRCSRHALATVLDQIGALGLDLVDLRLIADRTTSAATVPPARGDHPSGGEDTAPSAQQSGSRHDGRRPRRQRDAGPRSHGGPP